jgi:hypothetical protein
MNNVYIKRKDLLDFDCIREETLERMGINKDILSIEDLLVVLEELYADKERLEEELEDLKQDVRDNYKPISPYEMYGVSERDFI